MAEPYTIRIFVPDGDPDGVRIIDRMNWTGVGLVFPREKWTATRGRPESARTGVYILLGYQGDDELPTLYIGQGDGEVAPLVKTVLRGPIGAIPAG